MLEELELQILTPHETVLHAAVRSARVPADTGQVGLRPRGEPLVLVVEPGVVVLTMRDGTRYAATAGGLLESIRERAVIYTPFAVLGNTDTEVLVALEHALATPNAEIVARRRLGELEQRIVRELRHASPTVRTRSAHD